MGEDGSAVGGDVGTIVWVRRRNGSWWPGRILGQHELSASHLMSPRSGTPVKLLGREDASVDWYNLEKSKRVKAFRCGEFDACIEKAEAAQGIPIKKREKYARREDAIIHALELERQMLEGRSLKLGGGLTNQHSDALKKESIDFPSEMHFTTDGTSVSGKHSKCRKVGLPVALTAKGKPLSMDAGVVGSLYVNDYGASDMVPRMRGLQDFGLQATSSKRKVTSSVSYESCKNSFLMDSHEDSHPRSTRDADGWYNIGNKKSSSPLKNRKLLSGLNEEIKRRDRRRPLLQVLQSSAKLHGSPPIIYNGYDSMKVWPNHFGYNNYLEEENAFSGIIDPYDPELPEKLGLDPEMEHEEPLISSTSPFVHELIDLGRNEEYGHGAVLLNDQDGCADRSTTSLYGRPFDDTVNGVSRWNLKGKRNTRKLSKRSPNLDAEKSIYHEGGVRSLHQGLYTGDSDDSDSVEKDLEIDLGPADKVGFQPILQRSSMYDVDHSIDDSDKDSGGMSVSTWDSDRLHHAPQRRQWDDPHRQFGHAYTGRFRDRIESGLVDVNLEVQASYQGERVPLVSLMSRLNGKAIIGHPLQVETLSDGFTDMFLPENDSGGNPSQSFGTATQPVWRTGRRTSLPRIPRPHTTTTMEGREGILHYADFDSRNTAKRPLPVHYDEIRLAKKKSHSQRPTKKSHKKSSKKASLSNLKTRTLSSLSKGQKNASGKPSSKASPLSILMKPGDTVPMATCVPVKVVFSRILEAVGRSPSHAAVHRHLSTVTGLDGRKPS